MNSRCALVSQVIPSPAWTGRAAAALFLGCNLRCKTCHNPWTIGRCNDCGDCVPHCPHDALNIQAGRVWWQESQCQQCDTCLHLCQQQATPMAQRLSVEEILAQVHKAAPFIEGVTVSGGEATTLPFLIALFTAIKTDPPAPPDVSGGQQRLLGKPAGKDCCRYWMARWWISRRGETNITAC